MRQPPRLLSVLILAACCWPTGAARAEADPFAPRTRLDAVWNLVRDDFFDPQLRGLDWAAVHRRYRAELARRPEAVAAVINAMLAELGTSHLAYFTPEDTAYYQLLALFEAVHRDHPLFQARFGGGPVRYPGIGIFTRDADGETVVLGVLEGQPAADAGLLRGDVIDAVDGRPFRPVASFAGKEGRPVTLTVRRMAAGPPISLTVTPRALEPATLFHHAMRASAQVVETDGVRVGYVHAWSYAGEQYQTLLEELVHADGPLADADALVLDLRDGWGGASPDYLRLFAPAVPVLEMIGRDGTRRSFDRQWRKPLVAVINGGTRSGKETLAWGIDRYRLGTLVGTRTGGAVVAGRSYLLADGCLLYLAVADVRVDGQRLEGVGVAPHVEVADPLRFAAGRDPQRARAIEIAAEQARAGAPR